MRNLFLTAFLLVLLSTFAFATAQEPDRLLYDNKVHDLFTTPLSDYYKTQKDKPSFYILPTPNVWSSGNERGYVAIWEITDGELYLRGLMSWLCDSPFIPEKSTCRRADLKELFGERAVKGKVFASWFTGELQVPEGKPLKNVIIGFRPVYERDIMIKVEAGKVKGQTIVDNTKKEFPSYL